MRYAALLIFFLLFTETYAQQEDIFRNPLNSRTNDAFIAVCTRLSQRPFTRGNFEQEKILNRLNRSLKSSGNFIIAAQLGMVWDTVSPFPSTLVLGRDYMVQFRPGGQKTVLNAQGNEIFLRMADVLSAVFSGNAQGLLDNFDVYFIGTTVSWELGLIPKNNAINSFAQRIIMNGDDVIRSIQISEQNGDSVIYILSNHSFPAELNVQETALFSLP